MSRSSLLTGLTRKSITFATTIATASAQGSMNSLVLIEREGGYNVVTREYDDAITKVVYDHPTLPGSGAEAGVTVSAGPITMEIGDEPQYYDSLTLYLPATMPVLARIDDLVTVLVTPDADLVDRLFRVTAVAGGGRIYSSNKLSAIGIAPSKQWSGP
ncbi:MAG: hypothetical protein ABI934_11730 [Actinomycetota bacterium]